MRETIPLENLAIAPGFPEAVATLKGMIERATAARRGNQAEADQQVEHGYKMQEVPVRFRLQEPIASILVAYPAHLGAAADDTLIVYYGELPPGWRRRDPLRLKIVHDIAQSALPKP